MRVPVLSPSVIAVLFTLLSLLAATEPSQSEISLESVAREILISNPTYQQALLSFQSSRSDFEGATIPYSPVPFLSLSTTDTEGGQRDERASLSLDWDTVAWGDLSLSTSLSHCREQPAGLPCGDPQVYDSSLSLSWSVPLGRGSSLQIKRATLTRAAWTWESARITVFKAKQSTLSQALSAVLSLQSAIRQESIQHRRVEESTEFLRQQEVRFNLGLISEPTLARTSLQSDQAGLGLLSASESVEGAWENLNRLMGWAISFRGEVNEEVLPTPLEAPLLSVWIDGRGILNDSRLAEISLRRSALSLAEAQDRLEWPITLSAGIGGLASGSSFSDVLLDGNHTPSTATLLIEIPLDRRQERISLENGERSFASAVLEREESDRDIIQSLTATHRLIERRIRELLLSERAFVQARSNFEITKRGFQEGVSSLQDYLDAQDSFVEAETSLSTAKSSLGNAWLSWWRLTDTPIDGELESMGWEVKE
ncbi:TolC family protein [bacterium]|nr:TolC family protein [bacterium]